MRLKKNRFNKNSKFYDKIIWLLHRYIVYNYIILLNFIFFNLWAVFKLLDIYENIIYFSTDTFEDKQE